MEEKNNPEQDSQVRRVDATEFGRRPLELGQVCIHSKAAECLVVADVTRALGRHKASELQPGMLEALRKQAETESTATGMVISYHIAANDFVFGVATNPMAEKTFVELAPFVDLDALASWGSGPMGDELFVS